MLDVREMVRVKPHSERWKDWERERATAVGGTVLYVKATMTGVTLIVVRVVRFALEPVGKFCNQQPMTAAVIKLQPQRTTTIRKQTPTQTRHSKPQCINLSCA